jgi:hypothetical protein
MPVLLTVSETVTGAEVSDSLSGGSTGLDLGQVVNGDYSPITLKSANTGQQEVYIRHDATIDPITNVKFYVATFTGTYGGANSAAADFSTLTGYGSSDTGATKNNADGNSRGLHIDMDWQVGAASQFDYSRDGVQMRIFGKDYGAGLDGASQAQAFDMHVDSASYWNGSTEIDATTPVTNKIGKSTDTVLGNRCHFKKRFYLHTGATEGGILQYDFVISYSYTA